MTAHVEPIVIAGRSIGPDHPAYIVAELSGNHNQSESTARDLITEAHVRGADAIKLQTYTPDTMTLDLAKPPFLVKGGLWDGRTLFDLYREAHMPWGWQPRLFELAKSLGIDCFSTPFDETAVAFLEKLKAPAYKLASFELCDHALLRRMAMTGKPLIISTGQSSLAEIDEGVRTARDAGAAQILLLHCVSEYPATPDSMNLRTIPHLTEAFGCPVGLSDHTLGNEVAIAAVALGACMIEKHFTLTRSADGPDAAFSMEPDELSSLVKSVHTVEHALGKVEYAKKPSPFRRSLFVVSDIQTGMPFTRDNVRAIRPAGGLPPRYLNRFLGARAQCDIPRGTPLAWDHILKRE